MNIKNNQQGFTLIELMIVIAIIAILAAIALPAYQDYVVKARVSEVMLAASSARTAVAEAAVETAGTTMPLTLDVETQVSDYVTGVTYAAGVITATGNATNLGGDVTATTNTLLLTGTKASNGQVTWDCTGTILPKYLPASCK